MNPHAPVCPPDLPPGFRTMSDPPDDARAPDVDPAHREACNTFWLECYQILLRVGWIFKTETIIMPAVLDAVVDSGLLRGLLPVLNRGGQSVPPLVFSAALARRREPLHSRLGPCAGPRCGPSTVRRDFLYPPC